MLNASDILPNAYIYRITNLLNQKLYIGKSEAPLIIIRWKRYKNLAREESDSTHITRALRKMFRGDPEASFVWTKPNRVAIMGYFLFEVIEHWENQLTPVDLNRLEIAYISFYNTFQGFGYNSYAGGDKYSDWTDEMRSENPEYFNEHRRALAVCQGAREFVAVNLHTNERIYEPNGRPWINKRMCADFLKIKEDIHNAFPPDTISGCRHGDYTFVYLDDPTETSEAHIAHAKKCLEAAERTFEAYHYTGEHLGTFTCQREFIRRFKHRGFTLSDVANINACLLQSERQTTRKKITTVCHVRDVIFILSEHASQECVEQRLNRARLLPTVDAFNRYVALYKRYKSENPSKDHPPADHSMVDEYGCKFGIGDWWRKIPNREFSDREREILHQIGISTEKRVLTRPRVPVIATNIQTGQKRKFSSMNSCTKELFGVRANPSAWDCLNGKRDQYKGFRFDAQKERNQFQTSA